MARTRDEDAKERILRATRDLIADHGPAQASITEIAAAAGVGRGTIYRWWPTRPLLVIDALAAMTDTSMPFAFTGDVLADVRRQMRSMVTTFNGPVGAMIRELVADAQGDPEIATAFRAAFFDHRRDQARAFFRTAIEHGAIPPIDDLDGVIYGLYAPLWLALLIGHEPLTPATADRALTAMLPSLAFAAQR